MKPNNKPSSVASEIKLKSACLLATKRRTESTTKLSYSISNDVLVERCAVGKITFQVNRPGKSLAGPKKLFNSFVARHLLSLLHTQSQLGLWKCRTRGPAEADRTSRTL
jgi:hypothetical protein